MSQPLVNKYSILEIQRAKGAIVAIPISIGLIIYMIINTTRIGIFPIRLLPLLLLFITYPILMYYWFKGRRERLNIKEISVISIISAVAAILFGIFTTYFGTKILLGLVPGFEDLPKSSETISGIVSIAMGIGCMIFGASLAKDKGVK